MSGLYTVNLGFDGKWLVWHCTIDWIFGGKYFLPTDLKKGLSHEMGLAWMICMVYSRPKQGRGMGALFKIFLVL
jgi:hypothetical protein